MCDPVTGLQLWPHQLAQSGIMMDSEVGSQVAPRRTETEDCVFAFLQTHERGEALRGPFALPGPPGLLRGPVHTGRGRGHKVEVQQGKKVRSDITKGLLSANRRKAALSVSFQSKKDGPKCRAVSPDQSQRQGERRSQEGSLEPRAQVGLGEVTSAVEGDGQWP